MLAASAAGVCQACKDPRFEKKEKEIRSWEELGDEQQYQALLSDYFWGVNAVVVNGFVQEYLFSLWDARQLVIRGQSNRQQSWRGTPWP